MTARALAVGVLLCLSLPVAMSTAAAAHPLGNFSVNRFARIDVGPERTTLRYVLDLAEIPTLQDLQAAGLATDAPQPDVERAILAARAVRIVAAADLSVGGRRAIWEMREASLAMPEGQAGLRTMRIALTVVAALPVAAGDAVAYRDGNEPGRPGWHEVVLRGVDGVALAGSTVPAQDTSDELRRYPADPMVSPPGASSASARIELNAAPDHGPGRAVPSGASRFGVEVLAGPVADLLRSGSGGDLLATLLAVVAAAGIGAAHAITPGHGKTVIAAYLIGRGGTPRQAFALGGVVALSHTVGVLGLAAIVLVASTAIAPERFYPVASALSALIVLGIGVWLLRTLLRRRAHDHTHAHGHPHEHGPGAAGILGWRALIALGVSGGLVPSTSALLLLLAAAGLRRPDLGVVLVLAFGVGMASVLVGIGLTLVSARDLAARHLGEGAAARRIVALIPAATAAVVLIVGAGLSVQAGQQLLAGIL